ncbi:Ig-like domain-containing protein [Paracoccus salsus]|uniref:Ig-like domain-containing protein n=1 Tax=Paracoccus salsus TaxID=2911061 RepID=UPI001F230595|nr:Ig-like domain-containing protein [Paracoccus salsus]MCF3974606.1 Ig-like domain-containing protein [Paracoccus salsus]
MARYPVSTAETASEANYESGLLGQVYTDESLRNLFDALDRMNGASDAMFVSDAIDYGSTDGSLQEFLGDDALTLSDPALGNVSDLYALQLSGQIFLEAGTHRFGNVTDDGFRLTIGEETVAEYTGARAASATYGEVEITESGWYTIRVDYFEAWGATELRIGHSLDGGTWSYLDESRLRHGTDEAVSDPEPAPNVAPVAQDDGGFSVQAGQTVTIPVAQLLANDSDADGDDLSVLRLTNVTNGTAQIVGDEVRFTGAAQGSGRFDYVIGDGRGGEAIATVSVGVTTAPASTNTRPDARNDTRKILEDGQLTLNPLANDIDADGDTMTIYEIGSPGHGTVTQNDDGTLTYVPDANFNGRDSFIYRITDGNGGTDTARVVVNVTPVNDAPVAGDDGGFAVQAGESITIAISDLLANDTDADGDALSLVRLGDITNGTAEIVGDQIRFTGNGAGTGSFDYVVGDGNGGRDTARVSVNVTEAPVTEAPVTETPVNVAPVAGDDGGFAVQAGESITIAISDLLANDTDADGDALSLVRLGDITNGTAEIVGDQIRFTGNGAGTGSFDYVVGDGNGGRDTARVSVEVSAPPVIGDGDTGGGDTGGDTGGGDTGGDTGGDHGGHGGGDTGGDTGGDHGGHGGGDLIDPPQTAAEIAAFVEMVQNMPEHDMEGHSGAMAGHMAALNLVSRGDATHVAVNHGDWNDPSIWHNGQVPGDDARVLIPEGISVGYSEENDASIFTVRVDGYLHFATDEDSRLVVDTLVVSPTGHLEIGTEGRPVQAGTNVDIVFADNGNIDVAWDPALLSRGMVAMGEVDIAGQEKASHLKVQVDAMAGDTTLTLEEAPTGWQVGDKLVLTGTYQQGFYWNNAEGRMAFAETQDEEVTIAAISGNTVTLDRPLTFDHDTPREDLKAYVANMTRNVTFSSEGGDDLPAHQRGQVMFMHNDDVDVRYAGFNDLGRTDKSEYSGPASDFGGVGNLSPDANIEGRYPFHFHEAGLDDMENPAIAIGNVVDGSPGWGFVHHSSNANLTRNVSFDAWGAGFVAEDGNETGTWYQNIAIKGQGWSFGDGAVKNSEVDGDVARTGDGFWMGGRLVELAENVAANTTHGFVWLHRGDRDSIDPDTMHHSEVGYGRDRLDTDKPAIQGFRDNEAFGTNTGLIVVKQNPDQGHDLRSVFDGFLNWETREGIFLSYTGHYTFKDVDLVGQRPENNDMPDDTPHGVNLATNAFDMVFNGIRIDGFDHAFNMLDNNDIHSGGGAPGDFHNTVIDGDFRNIGGVDIRESFAGQLTQLDGSSLTPGQLEFRLTADRVISDADHMLFNGIKTDSIGSIQRNFTIEQQGLWNYQKDEFLDSEGYWRLPDGTAVALVEDFVTDRATGESLKQYLVFELDYPDSTLNSRYSYNGVINLGGPGPIANTDHATTSAGTALRMDLVANDSDPDGGLVRVGGLIDPRNGNVYLQDDGSVLYRPNDGFVGVDHFQYWAADEEGNFTRGEAMVTVGAAGTMLHDAMMSDMFDL